MPLLASWTPMALEVWQNCCWSETNFKCALWSIKQQGFVSAAVFASSQKPETNTGLASDDFYRCSIIELRVGLLLVKLPEVDFPQLDWGEKKKGVSLPSQSSHLPEGEHSPQQVPAALGSTGQNWQHLSLDRDHGETLLSNPVSPQLVFQPQLLFPQEGQDGNQRGKAGDTKRGRIKTPEASPAAVPVSAVGTHTHTHLGSCSIRTCHQCFHTEKHCEYPQHPARGTQTAAATEQLPIMNKLISHGSNKV